MKKKKTLFIALIIVSVATGQSGLTRDQLTDQKKTLLEEITDIDQKIQQNDSLTRAEQKRFEKMKKRAQDDIVTRENDISGLKSKLNELNNEITRLSGQIEKLGASERGLKTRRTYLAQKLVEQCEVLEKHISNSLPWDREKRLSRVTALIQDLKIGSAQIEDGFARLLDLVNEEIGFGDDIVLDSRSIKRNDGTMVNAKVLRIGNLWMVYVDASEELYGVLSRKNDTTFVWKEELNFAQREDIRTAIRVKDAKKAPQIVTLPLELAVTREEEK